MATKRLTLELSIDQYEFVRKEAAAEGLTISGLIRALIDERRASPAQVREGYRDGSPFSGLPLRPARVPRAGGQFPRPSP